MIDKQLLLAFFASSAVAGAGVADGCVATDLATCRYTSDLSFEVGVADDLLLRDPERGDLPVPLLVRYPIGATDAPPVVIWHHGGSPSARGKGRSEE